MPVLPVQRRRPAWRGRVTVSDHRAISLFGCDAARHFSEVASQLDIHFLDAGEFITPSLADPIHWDAPAHQIIGQAVADSHKAMRGMYGEGRFIEDQDRDGVDHY